MEKVTIDTLRNKKNNQIPIVGSTAYNYWQAQICQDAEVDWVLVGDSAANVEHGHKSTIHITLEECLTNTRAVCRGNDTSFIVGDMPFGSYEVSPCKAVENAQKFIEAGSHCVKLEGPQYKAIKAISNAGILVFAHLGLTPQSVNQFGGYKSQGRTVDAAGEILNQSKLAQDYGADLLLLEAMPPEAADRIADRLQIPVISIGAGRCDGQLLIFHDMVGLCKIFKPRFAKQYCNGYEIFGNAIKQYVSEVRSREFPSEEYYYRMKK